MGGSPLAVQEIPRASGLKLGASPPGRICCRAVRARRSGRRSAVRVASGTAFPEGITVGPDLLPGNPGTPALEVPAVPGAFCPLGWPCVVTPCDQAGTASATMTATARPLTSFFMIRPLRLDVHSGERLTAARVPRQADPGADERKCPGRIGEPPLARCRRIDRQPGEECRGRPEAGEKARRVLFVKDVIETGSDGGTRLSTLHPSIRSKTFSTNGTSLRTFPSTDASMLP